MKNSKTLVLVLAGTLVVLGFSCAQKQVAPVPAAPGTQAGAPDVVPPSTVTGDIEVQKGVTDADKQYLEETGTTGEPVDPNTLLRSRKK